MLDFTASERPSGSQNRDVVGDSWTGEWRGPGCGDRCRRERVVVVGGAGGHYGAQDREYHDHREYEASLERRWRALARMLADAASPGVVMTGPLIVDLLGDHATIDGVPIALGPSQWILLATLARYVGELVVFEDLAARLWGWPEARSGRQVARDWHRDALRQVVNRLRAGLGAAGQLVENVPRRGYRLLEVRPEGT